MKINDGIHWNIYEILPYQRNFNFINGRRSLGKTYTTLMYVIKECIEKNYEYIYLVRTQDEKKQGVFEQSHEKVINNEFKNYDFKFDIENCYLTEIDDNEKDVKRQLGYCIALSESVKIKKRSYPNVKYMIFDEYMLEKFQNNMYVNGWREPDLLLSIYHTVDRDEDRVMVFLLGNTLNFFNPYHMHPAFDIPKIEIGQIFTRPNVLFQFAKPKEKFEVEKEKSAFQQMIKGTHYGDQAIDSVYVDENHNFIKKMSNKMVYKFTIKYGGDYYGVYQEKETACVIISEKYEKSSKLRYALTNEDHDETTVIAYKSPMLKWLKNHYEIGNIFFENMKIKTKVEKGILLLL